MRNNHPGEQSPGIYNLMAEETSYNLEYMPAPHVDASFWTRFNEIVPVAENGTDRAFRFVWGPDRLEFYGGEWDRRYSDTDHTPPKFVGRCRWVLEMWCDPNLFNRSEWARYEKLLGPFPNTGTWDFVAFHVKPGTDEFLPLDESALNHVRMRVDSRQNGTMKSVAQLLEQKQALWAKRKAERKAEADKISHQFGEEIVKAFENFTDPVSTSGRDIGYKKTGAGLLIPSSMDVGA